MLGLSSAESSALLSSILQTNPSQPLAVWYYCELLRTQQDGHAKAMEVERVAQGGKKKCRSGEEEQASKGLRDALLALPLDNVPRSTFGKSSSRKMAVARDDVGVLAGHAAAAQDAEFEGWDGGAMGSSMSPMS